MSGIGSGGVNVPYSSGNQAWFNIKTYGAIGNGTSNPASSVLGISTRAQLAVHYPWITNSLFQYAARLMVTAEVASGSTVIPVVSSLNVPAGAAVSGPSGTIAGGTTVSTAPAVVTVNTTLSANVSANATVIPLASSTGINQSSKCNYGGAFGFNLWVQGVGSNSVTVVGSGSVSAASSGSSVGFSVSPQSITLSTATTATIHQGQYLTVTLAMTDAQAAALEMDWLGFQSAIQAAKTAGGGRVYCPAGTYIHNWTLVIPECSGNFAYTSLPPGLNDVDIIGDGQYNTLHAWSNDLGGGRCAISCGDPQGSYANGLGRYQTSGAGYYEGFMSDLSFACYSQIAPPSPLGVFCTKMSGMNWGARRRLERVGFQGFYAALNIVGDHTHINSVQSANSYYNLYFDEGSAHLFGDVTFTECMFGGAAMASVAIHANANPGILMTESYLGDSPYAMFKEAGLLASNFADNIISGSFTMTNMEAVGNGTFYDSNGESVGTSGNVTAGTKTVPLNAATFESCYMSWGANQIATRPKRAMFDLGTIGSVKLINQPSTLAPGTSSVVYCVYISGFFIETQMSNLVGQLQSTGLPFMIGGSTENVRFQDLGGGVLEATIYPVTVAVAQNTIVEHNGYGGIAPGGTASSAPAAGYALHSATTSQSCIVCTKHSNLTVKADTSISYPAYIKKGTSVSVAACTGTGGIPAAGEVPIGRIMYSGGSSGAWTAFIVLSV